MPRATKSAVKFDPAIGDVRTHIWSINDDAGYSMFTDDGKFAKDALSPEFCSIFHDSSVISSVKLFPGVCRCLRQAPGCELILLKEALSWS